MKKLSILIIAVILVVVGISLTRTTSQQAQNITAFTPQSLPVLETERLAREPGIKRDDTGRLTAEAMSMEHETISTRSTLFVMENVKESNVNLPITGDRAKIGVFSPTDGNLDIRIQDATGNDVPVKPHARNLDDQDSLSRVTVGRGNPNDGSLLVSDRTQLNPGLYKLNILQSRTPVDIIVNDQGGPELNIWLAGNGRDSGKGTTVYAKLVDATGNISGAKLVVKVKGAKGSSIQMSETEPGIYSAVVDNNKFAGINTLLVEAKGNTKQGLNLVRNGSIDIISGKANAKLMGIVNEELTETDLVVTVNVKVTANGRYYLRGNLLGSNNEPIAWAQDAQQLTPGKHTLSLRFARELINQSGFNTGLKVSDVELMNTTEMPGIKAAEKIDNYSVKSAF